MGFFSNMFTNKANVTEPSHSNSTEKESRMNERKYRYVMIAVPEFLLSMGYRDDFQCSAKHIQELGLLRSVGLSEAPIIDISLEEKVAKSKDYITSIWACGTGFASPPGSFPVSMIFNKTNNSTGNMGYKEKYKYLYRIGITKTAKQLRDDGRINVSMKFTNANDIDEYLSKFSEQELTVGENIYLQSNDTYVILVGPKGSSTYDYSAFVDGIIEGTPYKFVNILKIG